MNWTDGQLILVYKLKELELNDANSMVLLLDLHLLMYHIPLKNTPHHYEKNMLVQVTQENVRM